jgi:hypothetical protein
MQTTQYVSFEESYTEYGEDISLGVLWFVCEYLNSKKTCVERFGVRMDGETFEINLN